MTAARAARLRVHKGPSDFAHTAAWLLDQVPGARRVGDAVSVPCPIVSEHVATVSPLASGRRRTRCDHGCNPGEIELGLGLPREEVARAAEAERDPEQIERSPDGDAPPARPFPTVRIMVGAPPSPPSMMVDRFLVDRDINLLTGPGGSAKSTALLTAAVCVAINRPLFGTLAVRRSGRVLLFLPEDGESNARMMFEAIVAGLDLQAGEVSVLRDRLVMVRDEAAVNITRDATRIRDTALESGAELVCLDPLSNLLAGAEENLNDVANGVCTALRREVCHAAGATLLMTMHHRKASKDAPDDADPTRHDVRGGGGWVDGSRLTLGVRKRGNRLSISSLKTNRVANDIRHELDLAIVADPNNAAHWLSCRLVDSNKGAIATGATSEALTPGVGRAINENERRALEALDDRHEPGRRVSWSEWTKTAGLNLDTLKTVKKRVLNAKLADAIEVGIHRNGGKTYVYAINDRGRSCLDTGFVDGVRV